MASNHEHVFDDRWRCAICDEPARRVLYQIQQQLADTREELRIALAQRQNYRAYWTQARGLLEELLVDPPGTALPMSRAEMRAKIRAFLAQENAAG